MRYRCPLLLGLCLQVIACAPLIFGDGEAALVLEDVVAGSGPSRLKQRTDPPHRERLQYLSQDGRHRYADLYHPADTPAAGLVLIPGVTPTGNDDPRLVALATTLARVRFLVLVPDIPGFRDYKVRSSAVQAIEDAFLFLRGRGELAPAQRVGFGAISFGVGPALLASLRPILREQVDFVIGVGGYYELERVISFFTTGQSRPDGHWPGPAPAPAGKWVYALSNAELLVDPNDRKMMESMARSRLYGYDARPPPDFGRDARALYDLIVNTDPNKVTPLIRRLPHAIRAELTALDPAAHDLAKLKARLILLHGRGDSIIPYPQSVALAQAVPEGRALLFVVDGLAHVDLRPKLRDLPRMRDMVDAVLALRLPATEQSSEQLQPRRPAT
jgi:hypothetical protein